MKNESITKEGQPFLFLETSGTDYEIGTQIGKATAVDILDRWEEFTLPRMETLFGTPPERYSETYKWLRDNLHEISPGLVERIEGIAAGADIEPEKVWIMNFYATLWSADGLFCSTAAVKQSDQGPILAQNLDIGSEDFYFVAKTTPKNGYTTITEASCAIWSASTGINEKGLAVGSSNLASAARKDEKPISKGINNQFIPKMTLENCANVAEAVEFIKALPPISPLSAGYQMNFIDADGNMAVIDKTGPHFLTRQCEPGLNFTTNYSLDEELNKWVTEGAETEGENNFHARAKNIRSAYAALNGETPTVQWLKELFRSHEGIGRLCRHGEEAYAFGYSRLGFILYPQQLKAEISNGWPCCNEYQEFSL